MKFFWYNLLKDWACFFVIFALVFVIFNYVVSLLLFHYLPILKGFLLRVAYGSAIQFLGGILSFCLAGWGNKNFLKNICYLERKKFIFIMAWGYSMIYLPLLMVLAFGLTYLAAKLFPNWNGLNIPAILGVFSIIPSSLIAFGIFYGFNWYWRYKMARKNLIACEI